jgi:hypothetical protein
MALQSCQLKNPPSAGNWDLVTFFQRLYAPFRPKLMDGKVHIKKAQENQKSQIAQQPARVDSPHPLVPHSCSQRQPAPLPHAVLQPNPVFNILTATAVTNFCSGN